MNPWVLTKQSVESFVADEALTRGAAIAFYTATSLGPVLFLVVAIAGLVFGEDAARGAIVAQLGDLMGQSSAELLQTAIQSAGRSRSAGIIATIIGAVTLLITASGVFGEMQHTLNVMWRADNPNSTVSTTMLHWLRTRLVSLGLVATLGFLLLVSLVISALLSALSTIINTYLPFGSLILQAITILISFTFITVLIGAIYKILPDRQIAWRDVLIGALVTAFLFTIGKLLISLYIGSSTIASSYGAAGSFIIILLWIYYSAQIFLLGAEFTKVYAHHHGSFAAVAVLPGDF